MRLRRRHHPFTLRLQPDTAEQVVRHQRHQQRQHHDGQQKAEQETLERVGEGVVADVPVELGVALPEGLTVAPQQPGPPPAGRRDTRYYAEQDRHAEQDQDRVRFDGGPVALEILLLEGERAYRRPQPVREQQVGAHRDSHQRAEDDEQQDPRRQDGVEDLAEADRPEEEQVGVDPGEDAEQNDQNDEHDQSGDEDAGTRHQWPAGCCHSLLLVSGAHDRVVHLEGNLRQCPTGTIGEDGLVSSPDISELTSVVLEVERHVADLGWDQPSQVYALADTSDLVAREPALAAHVGQIVPGSLTPVEQEPLPVGRLDEVLAGIGWPPEVLGCVLVTELVVLPPSAEQEAPYEEADIELWAANHPERQDVRLAVGVTRDGQHASCLRVRGDEELVVDPDLADGLVDGLLATFR